MRFDIIHTADWHIWDKHKYSYSGSRLQEIKSNIYTLIHYAIKNKIKMIVVCGDIFHVYNPDEKILKVFAELVHYAISNGVMLRVITGDHDYNGINYSLESLKTVYDYKNDDMFKIYPPIKNKPSIYLERVNGVVLVFVPFQDKMKSVLKSARDFRSEKRLNTLFTHTGMDKALYSNKKKSIHDIKPTIFDGWDYVGLGDYHMAQDVTDKVKYAGSIIRVNYGERDNQIGFNHIIIKNNKIKIKRIPLNDIEFIEISIKYDSIDDFMKNYNDKITIGNKKIENSIVKLFIYGDIKSGFNISLFKKWLYSKGVKDVDDKLMGKIDIKVNNKNDASLISMSPDEACIKYLSESKKNKKYKYGVKVIKECL